MGHPLTSELLSAAMPVVGLQGASGQQPGGSGGAAAGGGDGGDAEMLSTLRDQILSSDYLATHPPPSDELIQACADAFARAFARCRLSRSTLVGVPRAVLDARPRRGAAAARAAARADDLNAFRAWQAHSLDLERKPKLRGGCGLELIAGAFGMGAKGPRVARLLEAMHLSARHCLFVDDAAVFDIRLKKILTPSGASAPDLDRAILTEGGEGVTPLAAAYWMKP